MSHRITDWDPEDVVAWEAGNKNIARRNLIWSVAAEHIGFSVWSIWSVMVLFMPEAVYGFTAGDKFLLGATATLVGGCLRIPYTLATATFGGRNWTVFSAFVLLIPTVGTMLAARPPGPSAVAVPGVRSTGRPRRRQLRVVDDQHQRVLPAAAQGLGTGHQRRRRQHRGADGPARRPARHRHPRQPPALLGVRGLPGRAGHRGDRRRALHGQPRAAQDRPDGHGLDPAGTRHLGDLAALHRHVRLVHRLRVRVRPGAADQLRRGRSERGAGVAARRADRVHRPAARVAVAGVRRQASRPHRRWPGDAVGVRRDDPRRRNSGRGEHAGRLHLRPRDGRDDGRLRRRLHRAVPAVGHRQRIGLQDDPVDLRGPQPLTRGVRGRARGLVTGHVRRADRLRRRRRRARRRRHQPGAAAVVSEQPLRDLGILDLPGVLCGRLRGDLGRCTCGGRCRRPSPPQNRSRTWPGRDLLRVASARRATDGVALLTPADTCWAMAR